jgi:hypothetical protein
MLIPKMLTSLEILLHFSLVLNLNPSTVSEPLSGRDSRLRHYEEYIWPAIQSFEGPASSAFSGWQSLLQTRYYGLSWILAIPQRSSMEANKVSRKKADKLLDLKFPLHY